MSERRYTASLSKSQGRAGWSIIFRHPVRRDEATGQPGLRVRRGLGTRDDQEAEQMKEQLNELLSNSLYWEPSARAEAERRFDSRVVEIFFDKMAPESLDHRQVREEVIPLPSSENSDYRRVLMLGTTGAGKTTLVRQLIGTHPIQERFPSTSTAKTTTHDTEIVLDEGPFYRAVVTFTGSDELREYLNECISAALLRAYQEAPDTEVLRQLLYHVNQRYRFSYVLGNGPTTLGFHDFEDEDEDEDKDDLSDDDALSSLLELGKIDLNATNELLSTLVSELRNIARKHGDQLRVELRATEESDQRVVDEIFEEELDNLLREDDAFHSIADRLMDEIEKRFDLLEVGELRRSRQGWPLSWSWNTDDRQAFVKAITRFSSNHSKLFGTLLTPLVNGIRVAGSFYPLWNNSSQPKLVLIDGEGLGHTPKSSAAISTILSRRIEEVDAVLLVDNATQPMQAASVAAMRELVSSGNASKLLVVFTHFDEVKGDNLPTTSAKARHVLASAENVLASIGEDLGPFAERALRKRLETHCYFLSAIHEHIDPERKVGKRTIAQLLSLLSAIDQIVDRPEQVAARPIYDRMQLGLNVRKAAENFHDAWLPILGLAIRPGVSKENWGRIKALSRRLATPGWSDEYDTLKPVADLRKQLQDQIYVMIQNPVLWDGPEPSDDEKQQIFESLAAAISRRLLDLASRRIRVNRLQEWQKAYFLSGRGSTFARANIIASEIYDRAAPIPDVTPSPERSQFLREVSIEVEAAANEVGAILR